MMNDNEIGRVVAVDTAQVTVELNRDLKAFTRSTYEGTLEVGRINSYIIIPVGPRRIVAMVTRVVLTEESELKADKTMVALPSSRRLMKATMIGTIDERKFRQGISLFPVLDSPVLLTGREDLNAIFGKHGRGETSPDLDEPGYCIPVGRSVVFPDYDIKIDPDAFFGKHTAIIGSTGSGKSCSISTILQSIIERPQVAQTRFVILDTNGEYRSAFEGQRFKSLYIPTDPSDANRLVIPYWFMDSDDFTRLFRAAPGIQRPVLLNALSNAREASSGPQWFGLRDKLIRVCNSILGFSMTGTWQDKNTVINITSGAIEYLEKDENEQSIDELAKQYPLLSPDEIYDAVSNILKIARSKGQYDGFTLSDSQDIEKHIKTLLDTLSAPSTNAYNMGIASSDSPRFFSKQDFRYQHLEGAISQDGVSSARTRDNCSTMLMRIYRLFEDSRFEFLFGPTSSQWPKAEHSLATFLRDVFGIENADSDLLSSKKDVSEKQLPFYDRQRAGAERSNVVIIDLSLLAAEVLENVTALLGRLILEFLQRLSDPESGVERGGFPVVLVLEEAQNYIRQGKVTEDDSISKIVFERIAREGRKYGLGLVVASQRPSELSKTVLSQCNSFIVHRLQNPEDLRYFREIVPGIYGQLLDQLPALAPRNALILGECIQAPALVQMREVNPVPKSKNPKFYKSWVSDDVIPNVENVCAKWEGNLEE